MPRRRSQMGELSELNVTPLLDLAFVLLIIFMITAPFLNTGAELQVPTTQASREAIDPARIHRLRIDLHGQMALDAQPLAAEELVRSLAKLRRAKGEIGLLIESDRSLTVASLVSAMDLAAEAGVTKVALLTQPEGQP
ncbi:MAG: biopolymer transporter ExbD [Verrucomicrobiota bacterium]